MGFRGREDYLVAFECGNLSYWVVLVGAVPFSGTALEVGPISVPALFCEHEPVKCGIVLEYRLVGFCKRIRSCDFFPPPASRGIGRWHGSKIDSFQTTPRFPI